jgi:hypothetical protein
MTDADFAFPQALLPRLKPRMSPALLGELAHLFRVEALHAEDQSEQARLFFIAKDLGRQAAR